MRNFKGALLINRYIGELESQISAQEKRLRAAHDAGVQDREAERQLTMLRGSLAALQFRALSAAGGR